MDKNIYLFLLFLLKKDESFQDNPVFRGTTVHNIGPRAKILCLLEPMVRKIVCRAPQHEGEIENIQLCGVY